MKCIPVMTAAIYKCDSIKHKANNEYKVPPTSKYVEMNVAVWSHKHNNFEVMH